ncbi:hypothetical protein K523DRAFT_319826 [Schizophyllum commune Tattone D]|nr:hypothetical protein K523DRAFT_319826 [Schizophyllum commune Tattone D]
MSLFSLDIATAALLPGHRRRPSSTSPPSPTSLRRSSMFVPSTPLPTPHPPTEFRRGHRPSSTPQTLRAARVRHPGRPTFRPRHTCLGMHDVGVLSCSMASATTSAVCDALKSVAASSLPWQR